MAAPPRILVTRSQPGASETARRLSDLGYAAVVEPVFVIEAILAALPPFDALAFTSANGVRALASLSPGRDAPVYAVGARTADVARELGFADVTSADGDVDDLLVLVLERLPAGAALLHVGNQETRGDLAGRLRAAGAKAEHVALYHARPLDQPGPALAAHLAGTAPLDAVLIHSPRGAAILAQLADGARGGATPAARFTTAAISSAAFTPIARNSARHAIAREPTEDALLAALQSLVRP